MEIKPKRKQKFNYKYKVWKIETANIGYQNIRTKTN